MKLIWIPIAERVVPPWTSGYRPWIVTAKIVDDKPAKQ